MVENNDLKKWIETIQDYIEWNLSLIEQTQKVRERGYTIFAYDIPISIEALRLRIEDLKKVTTPNIKDCKKIRKKLEDSMKMRMKGLAQEVKYYQDIQKGTIAGRFGRSSVTFSISMSDSLLEEAIKDFSKLTYSN
jgi:hypothetical protein